MSYKVSMSMDRVQRERQEEKLRIARQALARVEAKYARQRHTKHAMESPAKRAAQRSEAK